MHRFNRIALMVLDSAGIGAMPDADLWGDAGADTLGHILAQCRPHLPNLRGMGLGNIKPLENLPAAPKAAASFGKAAIRSNGKDTTVGHWEMAGQVTAVPFPIYTHGFPARIIDSFTAAIGRGVLGNTPASGTEIIRELGEEHIRTGMPIIYTSADSVFQIAAHEEVIPLEELYRFCEIARKLLNGPDRVARVIARPFIGSPGAFQRTTHRKDFGVAPSGPTLLDTLKENHFSVVSIGKIASIFNYRGTTEELHAESNSESVDQTIHALHYVPEGLIFANLVDFDMLWGHRRDASGYANGLEAFDRRIPELADAMQQDDCLIITADHGCDATAHGTDHTREYVPILVFGKKLEGGIDLGTRSTMADIGQTIAENFGLEIPAGTSFLSELI